jgi:hypothetical protein
VGLEQQHRWQRWRFGIFRSCLRLVLGFDFLFLFEFGIFRNVVAHSFAHSFLIDAEHLCDLDVAVAFVDEFGDDIEVLAMFREVTTGSRGGNRRSPPPIKDDNVINEPEQGNSRSYLLSRLKRRRRDLFDKVVAGMMAAIAAMVVGALHNAMRSFVFIFFTPARPRILLGLRRIGLASWRARGPRGTPDSGGSDPAHQRARQHQRGAFYGG